MGQEVARGEQGNIGVKIKPNKPPGLFAGIHIRNLFFKLS